MWGPDAIPEHRWYMYTTANADCVSKTHENVSGSHILESC